MTRFHRSGHFRQTRHGTHWVCGHDVHRDDWDRSGGPGQEPTGLPDLVARHDGYFRPNARCPVCGDPVFYVEPAHGGRVYFDELGPPWPKHPCTDIASDPVFCAVPDTAPAWLDAGWRPAARIRYVEIGPDRAALHFENGALFDRMDVARDDLPRLLGPVQQRRVRDPDAGWRDEISAPTWPGGTPVLLSGPTGIDATALGPPDVAGMTEEDATHVAALFTDDLEVAPVPESVTAFASPYIWTGFRGGRPCLIALCCPPQDRRAHIPSFYGMRDAVELWLRLLACAPADPRADAWADFDRRAEAWDRHTCPEVVLVTRDPLLAAHGVPGLTAPGLLGDWPELSYEVHELSEEDSLIHRVDRPAIDPVRLHAPMHDHARLLRKMSRKTLFHAAEVRGVLELFEVLHAELTRHGFVIRASGHRLDLVYTHLNETRGQLCLGASSRAAGIVIAPPEGRAGPVRAITSADQIPEILRRL